MTNEQIASLLDKQREYYKSGVTVPVDFRIEQLKKLYAAIKNVKTKFCKLCTQISEKVIMRVLCAK